MKDKYYEFSSLVLMGIILVLLGCVLFIGRDVTYQHFIHIVILVLLMNSFREIIKFIFRRLSRKDVTKTFFSCFLHLIVSILLFMLPNVVLGIVPFLFSIYLILIGIIQLVMCALQIKNKEFIEFRCIIISFFCFGVAIPILLSPVSQINTFLVCFSIYSFMLGLSMLFDAFSRILSVGLKNKLKRRIRITLPKIIEAIIPYSVMLEINRNLSLEKRKVYSFDKSDKKSDLHILIHTSNRGFNKMGHIDLFFDGKIISFGNYDEGSRKFLTMFGDGVLFMTDKKREYINFCIRHSKKTVFDFGLVLNDRQKDAIRRRIHEIMEYSLEWDYRDDKKYCSGDSYASKLYRKTKAKFYKFSKGRYHTYFVLWTNCCFLVDDILGKSGMDIVSINGIITPGTYYDYLSRVLKLKNSNVISKEIFNYKRRA